MINSNEYNSLKYLSEFSHGIVMTPIEMSVGVKAISSQEPVSFWYFENTGREHDIDLFYISDDCEEKYSIIDIYNVTYIVSPNKIYCDNFDLIYNIKPYVYKI
jgi:hypothetical protein